MNILGSRYPKSERLFLKTNQQVERMSEIVFMVMMKIALPIFLLPTCIISFSRYFFIDSRTDSFKSTFPMWFPFNLNDPIGYFIAITFEFVEIGYGLFIVACALSIGIGTYWLSISIEKDIQRILRLINDKAQSNNNQTNNELKTFLLEFIDSHVIVKQLSTLYWLAPLAIK